MALTPAPHAFIVSPSLVDNNEDETSSGLHVVRHSPPERKAWRGVVECAGSHIQDGPERGEIIHYTDFVPIGTWHVVPQDYVLAWGEE